MKSNGNGFMITVHVFAMSILSILVNIPSVQKMSHVSPDIYVTCRDTPVFPTTEDEKISNDEEKY